MIIFPIFALLISATTGAAGTVTAVRYRARRRKAKQVEIDEKKFECLSEAMPVFFAHLKRDSEGALPGTALEFTVYPGIDRAESSERAQRLAYHAFDYPLIDSMVAILVDAGFVTVVKKASSPTEASVYGLNEAFVARLNAWR